MVEAQTDCRHFSGYKPCAKNALCSSGCPAKQIAHPHILIIHLEALGAVLRGTVVLRAIKKKWPEAHITWVTNHQASPLLENNPFVDRLLKNDHDGVLALSTLRFDYTYCIDKSLTAIGLTEVPKSAGVRLGFGVEEKTGAIVPVNPDAQRLWELGLSNFEKFHVNQKPETRLIIEAMGLKFDREEYVYEFTKAELELIESEKTRLLIGVNPNFVIGLNTGCSATLPHKKLSIEGWCSLIKILAENMAGTFCAFLLLGGPEDTERNEIIYSRLSRDLDFHSKILQTPTTGGLRRGLIYTELCDLVVTGDSLGMHMAIALKKQVVCWFGPSCLQEIDFYDRGMGIKTEAPCSPCWKRECSKPVMCYDLVDYKKIAEAVKAMMNRPLSEVHSDGGQLLKYRDLQHL